MMMVAQADPCALQLGAVNAQVLINSSILLELEGELRSYESTGPS